MKKIWPCLVAICLALIMSACTHASVLASKRDSEFLVTASSWSGTQEHTLTLEAGQELKVEWNLDAGKMDLTIGISGQKPMYTANNVDAKDNPQASFSVIATQAGEYVISVSAKDASGTLNIKAASNLSE